ncbi:MAG: TlpA disulfide reductase family protein [Gemmatimonadales bacterium]
MRSAGWLPVLALVACGPKAFRPLTVGDPAPRYSVPTLAGDTVEVGRARQPMLVNIWATWCVPCREEFPELEAIAREYRDQGLVVLAVSIDVGADRGVREFVAAEGVTFRIGLDRSGAIQREYQTVGVPESFLIDERGRLRWRKTGALRAGAEDARQAIDAILAPADSSGPAHSDTKGTS